MFQLSGKTALITGASGGIGSAIAKNLSQQGAHVVLHGTRAGRLEELASEIGSNVSVVTANLSDRDAVGGLVAEAAKATGAIDILVNNAGITRDNLFMRMKDEEWDEVLEVNLNAQFVISREIGQHMIARGTGKIIFTASLLTFQGGITVPGYAASKGGIGQLTKALANEWAGKGVNVNAIAPGYIATDNTQALQDAPVRHKAILERIPAGRWGTPEDFGGPAIFLASDASSYVNGEILVVDGGWMGR